MQLLVFGSSPALSLAEASALYGAQVQPLNQKVALLEGAGDLTRLGGSVKLGRVIDESDATTWEDLADHLEKTLPSLLDNKAKNNLGISLYGSEAPDFQNDLLALKRKLKAASFSLRLVLPQTTTTLSSAQVIHNDLTSKGQELIVAVGADKSVLALTEAVQDIANYTKRDRGRPKRDARVGMLPPKLAQIMLNLATGPLSNSKNNQSDATPLTVLDPFCGTGVVLQEALLMGYSALGSDNAPRMVDFTQANLEWLKQNFRFPGSFQVTVGDATSAKWNGPIDAVVSELDLGPPIRQTLYRDEISLLSAKANTLIKQTLKNLAPQLKPGTPLCLAVPAWRHERSFIAPLVTTGVDELRSLGYNRKRLPNVETELHYAPHGQIVARKLLILERL